MKILTRAASWSLAIAFACLGGQALAQSKPVASTSNYVPQTAIAFGQAGQPSISVTSSTPLPIICITGCSGGGGGGGAVTIADGASLTLGAKADAAWSGTGSGSVVAILKASRALQASIDAKLGATISVNCVTGCSGGGGGGGGANGFVALPACTATPLTTPTQGVVVSSAGNLGLRLSDGTNNDSQVIPVVAGQVFPFRAVCRSAANTAGVLGLN